MVSQNDLNNMSSFNCFSFTSFKQNHSLIIRFRASNELSQPGSIRESSRIKSGSSQKKILSRDNDSDHESSRIESISSLN